MPTASSRNARVDFLRGIAIVGVLLLHFTLAYGMVNSPLGDLLPRWLLRGLVLNGNFGVTIFFAISGFLITSNSLRRWGELRHIDLRSFYVMRLARIMPPLLLALAIIVALGCLELPFFTNGDDHHDFPATFFVIAAGSVLTFWHNVLMQTIGYFNYCLNIYWSLSVEEVFYLAMPILCLCVRRTWLLACVCGAAVLIGPMYRYVHQSNELFFMYGYAACFDAIAIGCLTALVARRFRVAGTAARAWRIAGALTIMVVYLRGIGGNEVLGFTLIALGSAAFLFGAAADARPGLTGGRGFGALRWMGRHSYEIYLFHIIVLGLMRNAIDKAHLSYAARLPWFVLFIGLTAALAALVARYVAQPSNEALRRRFLTRSSGTLPAAAQNF